MVLATDASLVCKIEANHKTHSIFSLKIGQRLLSVEDCYTPVAVNRT